MYREDILCGISKGSLSYTNIQRYVFFLYNVEILRAHKFKSSCMFRPSPDLFVK